MIWFAFFDEGEGPRKYDLLQLSESGPSVMRKKTQQIEIKLVRSIGMLPISLKNQSVQLQSTAYIIKNIFILRNGISTFLKNRQQARSAVR